MKQIWTSLKSHKNIWIFLGIILLFGMGVGVYFGFTYQNTLEHTLMNYTLENPFTHFSLNHFIVFSVLLISSFLLIGIPLAIGYFFYEGFSMGFCITIFLLSFHLKGLLYILLFVLLTKFIFLFLFSLYFVKILNIGKNIVSWIVYKSNKKEQLVHLTIGCLVLLLILFCYDLLIDFFGINLIHALDFLLK